MILRRLVRRLTVGTREDLRLYLLKGNRLDGLEAAIHRTFSFSPRMYVSLGLRLAC